MIAHLAVGNLAALSASEPPPWTSWTDIDGEGNDTNPTSPVCAQWIVGTPDSSVRWFNNHRPILSSTAFYKMEIINSITGAVYIENERNAESGWYPHFNGYGEIFELPVLTAEFPQINGTSTLWTARVTCRETNPVRVWPAVESVMHYVNQGTAGIC